MTRQSEKNLLITVAALATTAIVVVVFNSSPSAVQTPTTARARREADDGGSDDTTSEEPAVPDYGDVSQAALDAFDFFYETLNPADEDWSRNYNQDDLLKKGKKKKKGGKGGSSKFNVNKIKQDHINVYREEIQQTYLDRVNKLDQQVNIFGKSLAGPNPEFSAHPSDPEYEYAGYDKTSNVVTRFLNEFQCSSGNQFSDGDMAVHIMFPTTLPLFEDQPIAAYQSYVKFAAALGARGFPTASENNKFKFTVGQYTGNSVKLSAPKKFKSEAETIKANSKYQKPFMSAAQPQLFKVVKNLLANNSPLKTKDESSAATGKDCFLIWFFHDVPRDLDEFSTPEGMDMIYDLHAKCTIIPIFVSPNLKESWEKLGAAFLPGRELQYGKDRDYDGLFYADSVSGLETNSGLIEHINNYMCLAKNRCLCRLRNDGFVVPAVETTDSSGTTTAEAFRGVIDYDDNVVLAPTEGSDTTTTGFTTVAADEGTAKPVEIDNCCGHGAYTSQAYDSYFKTCCEDGTARAYADDGSDPCQ